MKILPGIDNFFSGDAENLVLRLAKSLSGKGPKIYLLVLFNWNLRIF
jgi:hypothetical protein